MADDRAARINAKTKIASRYFDILSWIVLFVVMVNWGITLIAEKIWPLP